MARVALNAVTAHLRGKFGDIVFKRIGGKLYATRRPGPRKTKPKTDEKKRMKRFRAAHKYAQRVMADPELKAGYAAAARKHRRRIYNLAVSDYLTSPEITLIGSHHPGAAGEYINVFTPNDYKVVAMHLVLRDAAGRVIERGEAVQEKKSWCYVTTQPRRTGVPLTVEVTAADRLGKTTKRTERVVFKA